MGDDLAWDTGPLPPPLTQTASTVVHAPGPVLPRPYSVIGTCTIIIACKVQVLKYVVTTCTA